MGLDVTSGGTVLVNLGSKVLKLQDAAQAEVDAIKIENNFGRDDFQLFDHYRQENATNWKTGEPLNGGNCDWAKQAPNGGAVEGTRTERVVEIGEVLDRFGSENGRYLANSDFSLEQRSLPPGTNRPDSYHQYEVLKPFDILQEEISPAFGQVGGEYKFYQ